MGNKKPLLASHKTCTGCMACVDSCCYGALAFGVENDGHIYPRIDMEKCVACGACTKVCPVVTGFEYRRSGSTSHPMAAWAKEDDMRINSASGGIFAALASYVIINGGLVAGAVMDGTEVKHILTDKWDDIVLMQGSKYQQGNLEGIHKQIRSSLTDGRTVLFSGMGCQVGGLLSFLSKKKYPGRLITIDIICGGFPSLLPLELYLKTSPMPVKRIISFRDKHDGWKSRGYRYRFKTEDVRGTVHDEGYDNIVTRAFSSHLTNRHSCMNCAFAYAHRASDITIGDYWGDKIFPGEHFKGLSVVVVHSTQAKTLLSDANVQKKDIRWEDFLPYNYRIVCGRYNVVLVLSRLARKVSLFVFRRDKKWNEVRWTASQAYHFFVKAYIGAETRLSQRYRWNVISKTIENEKNISADLP